MVQELIARLPAEVWRLPPGAALLGAIAGAAIWLFGAKFSRYLICLTLVTLGTAIGMRLPAWAGWSVDGMGPAVAAAIGLGVSGFLLHRTWIGVFLGATLAFIGALGTIFMIGGEFAWDWRSIQWPGDSVQFLRNVWQSLPPAFARSVPIAVAVGFAAGITLAVFLPKLSKVLLYSLIGTIVGVVGSVVVIQKNEPRWLSNLPSAWAAQLAMFAGLVAVGAFIQWRNSSVAPVRTTTRPAPSREGRPAMA